MAADLPPNIDLHEQLEAGTALQSPTFYETTINYENRVAQVVEKFRDDLRIEMSDEGDMTIVVMNEAEASRNGSATQNVHRYLDEMSDQAYEQYRALNQSTFSAVYDAGSFVSNVSETVNYNIDGNPQLSTSIPEVVQNKLVMEHLVDSILNGNNSSHAIAGLKFSEYKQYAKQQLIDSPERNVGWVDLDYETDQSIWKEHVYEHMTNDIESLQVEGISIEGQAEYAMNHEVGHILAEKYSQYYITDEAHESLADVLSIAYEAANGTLEQETVDRMIIQRSYTYIRGEDAKYNTAPAVEKFLETTNLESFAGLDRNEVTEKVLSESDQFMRTGKFINKAQRDVETGEKIGEMDVPYIRPPSYSPATGSEMSAILYLKTKEFGKDEGVASPKQIHYLLEKNRETLLQEGVTPEDLKPLEMIAERAYLITTAEDIELGLDRLEYEKPDTLHMNKEKEASLEKNAAIPAEMEATYPYDVSPEAQAEMTADELALASYNNEIVGKVWRDVETLEDNNLTTDERAYLLKHEERHVSSPNYVVPEGLQVDDLKNVLNEHNVAISYSYTLEQSIEQLPHQTLQVEQETSHDR